MSPTAASTAYNIFHYKHLSSPREKIAGKHNPYVYIWNLKK